MERETGSRREAVRQAAALWVVRLDDAACSAADRAAFEAWRDAQPDTDTLKAIATSDIAIQLYTSGTTGRPKGAMLTHDNLLAMRREASQNPLAWNQWGPDDVSLVAMPVAHIGDIKHGSARCDDAVFEDGSRKSNAPSR